MGQIQPRAPFAKDRFSRAQPHPSACASCLLSSDNGRVEGSCLTETVWSSKLKIVKSLVLRRKPPPPLGWVTPPSPQIWDARRLPPSCTHASLFQQSPYPAPGIIPLPQAPSSSHLDSAPLLLPNRSGAPYLQQHFPNANPSRATGLCSLDTSTTVNGLRACLQFKLHFN